MPRSSFLRGALLLAAAGVATRALGLLYLVLLPRILGAAGYGLFQMVKPVYHAAVVISIAGLPVAVAKLVAEKAARGRPGAALGVLRTALAMLLVTGGACTLGLLAGAPLFAARILRDPDAALPLTALAPSVLCLALASALRGFFQGLQRMGPSALSQVVEQGVRVSATVGLAWLFLPGGVVRGAAGAALGAVAGALGALFYLAASYGRVRGRLLAGAGERVAAEEGSLALSRRLLRLALPVVLGAVLWPVMGMLDASIVPARLAEAGLSREEVRRGYGYLGMAGQLMHFPTVLSIALAASLVPAVAEARVLGRPQLVQRRAQEALRVVLLFSLPAGVGLWAVAEPAAGVLFGHPQAGAPLRVLAAGAVALALYQTSTGVLQGLGEVGTPLRNLLAGAAAKTALTYWWTGIPGVGVVGAAAATVTGFAVAAALNLAAIRRRVPLTLSLGRTVLRPATGAALMGAATRFVHDLLLGETGVAPGIWHQARALVGAIVAGTGVYGTAMLLAGVLRRQDLAYIPRLGPALAGWLERYGLAR